MIVGKEMYVDAKDDLAHLNLASLMNLELDSVLLEIHGYE